MRKLIVFLIIMAIPFGGDNHACTNYIITRGASSDGSVMISYAADSHTLYGELYFKPAMIYPAGTLLQIYEWDTGKPLGKIRQASQTFSVIGNMNEFQVAIGETTFGGREELADTTGVIDYGSLIYITLQRAKSAREAIRIISELVEEYGYYSSGESFSISDKNEAWIMEIIGKGSPEVIKDKKGKITGKNYSKGAVWVALQIPDGYVSGHANQARITTFPFQKVNDFSNPDQTCFHSADVISFARSNKYITDEVRDADFSFSDTYAPVDFHGARFCDLRVWSMFNDVNKEMGQYWDYVKGNVVKDSKSGYAVNRMPLWIKPDRKISVQDMFKFMRNTLQGTELDMSKDAGAGPYGLPYRWRPLTWKVDGVEYCNERATATQQTGFSFITQSRNSLPDWIGGILWFGVDDAASTVYVPMYCGMTSIPKPFAEGNGKMLEYSETSAFWVFNRVSNFAYMRYNLIMPDVVKKQQELENKFVAYTPAVDAAAVSLFKTDPQLARNFINDYSNNMGNQTFNEWYDLSNYLLVKYIDGNVKKEKDGKFQYNGYTQPASPLQPGYSDSWKKNVVEETKDKLKVPASNH
ncbi:MAG: dipeptidase [Bacteroidales bacterium]|nr:dipeptidase [Bacteroidales bacterium]